MPAPSSDQILLEVQYLSLDPYMRGRMDDRKSYAKPLQIGNVMTGEGVALSDCIQPPRLFGWRHCPRTNRLVHPRAVGRCWRPQA